MEDNLQVQEQTEIQVIARNINKGLEAFETRKAELTKLKEDAAGLTIDSIDDKTAINQVSTWRKKLKSARVEIQKEGKAMRDPLTRISKSISSKEDELIDIISPTEQDLQSKEAWVKSEQDKIDQAEARRKQELIQARIDKLRAYGFEIDLTFITALGDEDFEKVLDNARVEYEKGEAIKVEEARLEQEMKAQILKDQEELKALKAKQAEADRIIKERQDELDRQSAELKKQQEEADREARFLENERKSKLRRDRVDQLDDIGGNGQEYFARYDDTVIVCLYDNLITLTDDEFSVIRDKHNAANFAVKEKKRIEDEAKAEKEKIRRDEELKKLNQQAIDKALADQKEKERLDAVRKQEELEKAGDKAVWADFISKLKALPVPSMNSSQYRRMAGATRKMLIDIYDLKP
jgi:hypothetical protein